MSNQTPATCKECGAPVDEDIPGFDEDGWCYDCFTKWSLMEEARRRQRRLIEQGKCTRCRTPAVLDTFGHCPACKGGARK